MFQPSSQHIPFRQQVISLSQAYPCPRCPQGQIEPFGFTETFTCTSCRRHYVPLKGGRFLYPAKNLGFRVAPTYWWDGYHWHFAGTTASGKQLSTMVLISLLPVMAFNLALCLDMWAGRPQWCNPIILSPVLGLLALQLTFLFCWDFDFHTPTEPQ